MVSAERELILSQVILSLQLPFAGFRLSASRAIVEKWAIRRPRWVQALAWTIAVIIAALNVWLLYQTFFG